MNKKWIFLFCLLLFPPLTYGQETADPVGGRLRSHIADRKDGKMLITASATRPEWVKRSVPSRRRSKVSPQNGGDSKKQDDGNPTTASKAPPKWVQRSGSSTQPSDFLIFRPLDPLKPPAGTSAEKFRKLREAQWKQALGGRPTDANGDLIQHCVDYELNPNITTALKALKHFNTLSHDKDLRSKAHDFNLNLFLTLDALKFELPKQAVIRENNRRRKTGKKLIEFSYRVGSSGKRDRQWVEWAAKGKDLSNMPIDEIYKLKKLSKSDDDLSNRVGIKALRENPLLNEEVNGKRMEDVVAQITSEWTGGQVIVKTSDLQMEFLSPTKAYPIIYVKHHKISVSEGLDGKWDQAWNEKWPNFLAANIAGNKEKYRGAFAEDQLHAWGLKAGYVMDMRKLGTAPAISDIASATTDYKTSGIADIEGRTPFPKGIVDPFGWMGNQYREAFLVHKGSVQDVAKYTQRMAVWWDTFNIKTAQDLRSLGIDISNADFNFLEDLARKIRSPNSKAELDSVIGNKNLQNKALERLEHFNTLLLLGGHRRHVSDLTRNLITVLRQYGDPGKGPTKQGRHPPTIDTLMAANNKDNAFYKTMETLATAYSNLPEKLIDAMNQDHARQISDKSKSQSPEVIFGIEVHKMLLMSMKRAQKAGARLRDHGEAFSEIHGLVGKLRDDINDHLKQIADGADLDGFIDQVIAGKMRRKRVRVIWDGEGTLPKVTWAKEQWDPVDVRDDLKTFHTIATMCGWSNRTYAEHLYEYFEGPDQKTRKQKKRKENILKQMRAKSWASLAVDGLRSLKNLYDPKNMKERFVELKTADGRSMRLHLKPTGGRTEAGLNLGVTSIKLMIKGAQGSAFLWKVYGDVQDFKELALNIHKTIAPAGAETMETRAQRYAMILSKTISLFEYAENVATWAKNPFLVDKLGSSLATAAELSADPFQDDAVQKLASAMLKDIALWVQPELAVAFALYEISAYGSTALSLHFAKEDFVNLLVENGDWEKKDKKGNDLPRPRLKAVYIKDGVSIPNDENTRKQACIARAASVDATGRFRGGPAGATGLVRLTKLPEPAWRNGIKLRKSGTIVHPRKDLITIFYKEGYETKDDILKHVKKSVSRIPEGGLWTSTKDWTKKWLEREAKVYVPTPEDATRIVIKKIRVDMKKETYTDISRGDPMTLSGIETRTTDAHLLAGVKEGTRKNFGFLVSEYWTRRQNIMECSMLGPLIEMATRRKEAEELEKIDFDKFLAEMQRLDKRMQELDRKVWAEIARSADPFKGPEYRPNDKKERYIPITKDYRKRTASLRTFLKEAKTSVDLMNRRKARGVDFGFQTPGKIQGLYSHLPNEFKSEGGLISQSAIVSTARSILKKMLKVVEAYEDSYGEMLNILAQTEKWVTQNSSINEVFAEFTATSLPLKPFHVRIRPGKAGSDKITAPAYERMSGIDSVLTTQPGSETKPVVEKWDKGYREEYDKVRDDLGEIIQKIQARLRDAVDHTDLLPIAGRTVWSWWEGFMKAGHQELATYHPYWSRMLRLRLQIRKIENMLPGAGEATKEEITAAVSPMIVDKRQGLEILEGWDGTETGHHLGRARARMVTRYKQLKKLAERMFDIEINITPEDGLKVSDKMAVTLKTQPRTDLKGPDKAEIAHLVDRYVWELAPQDTSGRPSDTACLSRNDGRFWPTEMIKAPKPGKTPKTSSKNVDEGAATLAKSSDKGVAGKTVEWKKRLRKSGKYKLRVIALSRHDVPLSSKIVDVEIKPAKILGKLEIVGEWEAKNKEVAVFMGIADTNQEKPRFRLTEAGDFDMPLCSFSEEEIPTDVVVPKAPKGEKAKPEKFPPKPFDAYAGVETPEKLSPDERGMKEPGMMLKPKTKRVPVRFEERATFKLEKPLKLEFSRGVDITVEVFDASGRHKIENAAVTIHAGGTSSSGYTAKMQLKPKDVVYAEVGYSGSGISVRRDSRRITFDPEAHAKGITLKVHLPFFPTGALTVKGRFVPKGGITDKTIIGGGDIWSNIADKKAVQDSGGFEFKNDRPVRVKERLEIKALVHRRDDKRLMKPVKGKVVSFKIAPQAVNDLGDIKVEPYDVTVDGVRVAVRDWIGKPMPEKGTTVTAGDGKANRVGEQYECHIVFKYKESIDIKASFAMPTGEPITGTASVSFDQFGDPFEPKPPEDPLEIDLGVYLPGSLKIKGRTETKVSKGIHPPGTVKLWLTLGHPDLFEEWSETAGDEFFDELTEPVRKDVALDLEVTAASDEATFTAKTSRRTPKARSDGKVAVVDFGIIALKATVKLVAVPNVIGKKLKEATALLTGHGFRVAPQDGDRAPKRKKENEVYQQAPVPKPDTPLKLARGAEIKLWAYGAAKDDPAKPYRPKARIESVRVDKPVAWRGDTVRIIARVFVEDMKKGNPIVVDFSVRGDPNPESFRKTTHVLYEVLVPRDKPINGDYVNQYVEVVQEWPIKTTMRETGELYPFVEIKVPFTKEQSRQWWDRKMSYEEKKKLETDNYLGWKACKITVKGKTNRLFEGDFHGPLFFDAGSAEFPYLVRVLYFAFGWDTYDPKGELRFKVNRYVHYQSKDKPHTKDRFFKVSTNAGTLEAEMFCKGSQSAQSPLKGVLNFNDLKVYCTITKEKLNGVSASLTDAVMTVSGYLDPGGPLRLNKPPDASGTFRLDAKYTMSDWSYEQMKNPKPIQFSGTWWAGRTAAVAKGRKDDSKYYTYPGEHHGMITGEQYDELSAKGKPNKPLDKRSFRYY